MKTIVTLKSWRRPYYLASLFESLVKADGFDKYKYIISIDNHDATKNDMIAEVKKFKEAGADIQLFYQKTNLGCAGNMRFCFDKAFKDTDYDYMVHLEEDNVIGKDMFTWLEWAGEYTKDNDDIFAINSFTRKTQHKWYPEYSFKPDENFYHTHFDCGGVWAMHRSQWDSIIELGDVFGAVGPCNTDVVPDKWKSTIMETDKGSWAYPFVKYFKRGKYCLSPMVSRSNNVGYKECVHVPSKEWFMTEVYDDRWIEEDEYTIPSTYNDPDDHVWPQPDYAVGIDKKQ